MPTTVAARDFWALLIVQSSRHRDKTQLQSQAFAHSLIINSLIITEYHYGFAIGSVYIFIEVGWSIKIKTVCPSHCVWRGEVVSASTIQIPSDCV